MKECNTLIYLFTKEKAATSIVRRGFKNPHFKNNPPILEYPPFLKIPEPSPPPSLPPLPQFHSHLVNESPASP